MPIIRKIMDLKTCKAITLPISWLRFFEEEMGQDIEYVAIEVDRELKVVPYVPDNSSSKEGD